MVTNDTLTPLRALVRSGTASHRTRRAPPRVSMGTGRMPVRSGPPGDRRPLGVLPARDADATRRAHATAEHLLERHGVVTRGAVMQERIVGGFAGVYKVLSAFEDTGRCRRGYFIEGLGAAQFGAAGAIDRLRTFSEPDESKPLALALAATDPANPYGAALPWPANSGDNGHRPGPQGRRAGRPRRRRADAVRRTRRPHAPDVERRHCAADHRRRRPRRRHPTWCARQADGREGRRRGAARVAATPPFDRLSNAAGFVSTPKGLRMRA